MTVDPNKLFFPNKAIRAENNRFFAGREDLLRTAVAQVGFSGFSAVVYGDRGVGKTSFGWQLLELLSGNDALVEEWNERRRILALEPIVMNLPEHCKCVWLECKAYMENIDGVLTRLVRKSRDVNSFSYLFPHAYTREFEQSREIIHDFFEDLMEEIKAHYPQDSVVIFLDEFDSLPDKSGMGRLIKSSKHARFVVIGIADDLEKIIQGHKSADRKLLGSEFIIPCLEESEINLIFDQAEQVEPDSVLFASNFRKAVIDKSGGYPYIVQAFGFFSTEIANTNNHEQASPMMIVNIKHFHEALDIILGSKPQFEEYTSLVEILETTQTRREILKIVSQQPERIKISQVRALIDSKLRRNVTAGVENLVGEGILIASGKSGNLSVKFQDPVARILVQLYFESKGLYDTYSLSRDNNELPSRVNQVFISYSHQDKDWLTKLEIHLKPLIRKQNIDVWNDQKIEAGAEWHKEISKALATAKVAVLLVSHNFLASDFIADNELPPLLNAAKSQGLTIIWIPISYCLYEETEIAKYQAAYLPDRPLSSLSSSEQNQALVEICKQIQKALND